MPETGAAVAALFGEAGTAAAVGEGAAAGIGAAEVGGAAAAGAGAAGAGSALSIEGAGALGLGGFDFGAGTGITLGAGAGELGASELGTGLLAGGGAYGAEAAAGAGVAPSYMGPGTPGAGAGTDAIVNGSAAANGFNLSQIFGKNSALAGLFSKGGTGLGAMQVLTSLYGIDQSRRLQRMATEGQAPTEAGMQAVQRSMAAQGYQGSGNMAAALQKYGMDHYSQTMQANASAAWAGQSALNNTGSSMGLLTAGLPALFGWNTAGSGAPAGVPVRNDGG